MVGDLYIRIAKLAFHTKEKSLPDTGRSLQSCIFIVQESDQRYSPAIRTPPNPGLPQLGMELEVLAGGRSRFEPADGGSARWIAMSGRSDERAENWVLDCN